MATVRQLGFLSATGFDLDDMSGITLVDLWVIYRRYNGIRMRMNYSKTEIHQNNI
jgi:hypothetical protein